MSIVSATGHRPDKTGGFNDKALARLIRVAVIGLLEIEATTLIQGMSQGWDWATFYAAHALGIPVVAAVPFEGQEKMWPPATQTTYYNILKKCAKVVYVSGPGYSPVKMFKRNHWMVDESNKILTLHNGDLTGGTAECLKYNETHEKKPVLNMWSEYLKLQG